jgi:hypothetical protein
MPEQPPTSHDPAATTPQSVLDTDPTLITPTETSPPERFTESAMLDVHPAHHAATTWRDFFIHIATIVLGLLIAVGLEQTVEHFHHRHQIAETREALRAERELNRKVMQHLVAEFRTRTIAMRGNLADFHYLQQHPSAPIERLPTTINWHNNAVQFNESVWTTAQQGQLLSLFPPEEVRAYSRLYHGLETASSSLAAWRAASSEARAYTVDVSSASALTPAEIQEEIRLTRDVLNRLYRFGSDLGNISAANPDFAYGLSREEVLRVVHESVDDRNAMEAEERALEKAAQSSEKPKP